MTRSSWTEGQLKEYLQQAPELKQDSNTVTTSAGGSTTLPVDAYQILMTTAAGTVHTDVVALPASGIIGQRHLIRLLALADVGDKIDITVTNLTMGALTVSKVEFAAVGDWVIVEQRDTKWELIAGKSGVITAA